MVHPGLHRVTESADPITHAEALAVVRREAPAAFKPADVVDSHGVYLIYADDYERQAYVDPGSGRFLGIDDTTDGVMGFMYNLHLCALSCKGYAGYLPFLEKPAHILGNEELTVGGLVLAVTAVLLLLLAATGIVVWWPGIRRLARGLRVRRRQGTLRVQLRPPQRRRDRGDPVPRHVGVHRGALRAQAGERALVRRAPRRGRARSARSTRSRSAAGR